jgi:GntR family transcriptional regulator/MocR family aminotransferase
MDVHISLAGSGDLSEQVYRQLLEAIVDGRLQNGARLPPTRELAASLKVSRNTVAVAYERLNAEGFTTSKVGSGTYVSVQSLNRTVPRRARRGAKVQINPVWEDFPHFGPLSMGRERYNFGVGIPDDGLFPWDVWRRIVSNIHAERLDGANSYGFPAGHSSLRRAIARHIGISRSVHAGVDDVLVTHGTQQALDIICRVLIAKGSVVAVEDPGYSPARRLFHSYGAKVEMVPVDEEGLIVDELPHNARLVYTTPSHQFPLGMAMSLRRRSQLIDWAEDHNAVIIEDDYDSEFRFDERSLEPLQSLDPDGRVIYLGTFSKTLLPMLRVGFLVAPQILRGPLRFAKQLTDWHNETITQIALAQFMEEGHFARHLRRANRVYGERHGIASKAVRDLLSGHLTMLPSSAGLHICAIQRADSQVNIEVVQELALQRGVAVQTLRSFIVRSMTRYGLVIGFGAIAAEDIEPGIRVLADIFDDVASTGVIEDQTHLP